MTRRTHARAWKLTKVAVKATGGDDWEMLAPTNDGCVIQSMNSKAHKWNVQVTTNRDELKVITTNIMNTFIRMQRHVTIKLLMGSIMNDVIYIHYG